MTATSRFERAVISSLLDIIDHDEVRVEELAAATGLDLERLLDGFSGSRCFTLVEVEAVCNALGVEVAEQIGMVSY